MSEIDGSVLEFSGKYFFSSSYLSFYRGDDVGAYLAAGSWPSDVVEVSSAQFKEFAASVPPANKTIGVDENLAPCWINLPSESDPTDEEIAKAARLKRDSLITAMSWRYERHASELRLGIEITDSIEALDQYAQALRDITDQGNFPLVIDWPVFEGSN